MGYIDERCKQRQRKLDGLETWQPKAIVSILPLLLRLSLLFFNISLSANLWTQQNAIASLVIGTTVPGVDFYTFTVFTSLISPDCPFHTPVSIVLNYLRKNLISKGMQELRGRTIVNGGSSASPAGFLSDLQDSLKSVSPAYSTQNTTIDQ